MNHLNLAAIAGSAFSALFGNSGYLAILIAMLPFLFMFGTVATGGLTAASFEPILKELYTKQRIEEAVLGENRFLRYLRKNTKFSGKKMPIPIKYGNPQGTSHTFATAKANVTTSKYTDFYLTVGEDFGFVNIDHKTWMASRNDMGSFLRAKEPEIDGMLASMGRRMSIELYGNGSGAKGQLAAIGHTKTVTLVNHRDITKFALDQIIVLASDSPAYGTVGAGVRAGRAQIVTIDYDNGSFTIDDFIDTTFTGEAINDYIYIEGDYGLAPAGLAAWFPETAPTAGDDFFDVDRSINPVMLSGVRYDANAAGDSPLESLVKLASKHAIYARNIGIGKLDALWCGPNFWTAVSLELGPKCEYVNPGDEANFNVGASGIRINYEGGSVPLFSDIDCDETAVYGTNRESLELLSMGEAPSIFDADGTAWLRSSDTNGLDVQAYGYWNLACDAPVANARAKVTAQASLFG